MAAPQCRDLVTSYWLKTAAKFFRASIAAARKERAARSLQNQDGDYLANAPWWNLML